MTFTGKICRLTAAFLVTTMLTACSSVGKPRVDEISSPPEAALFADVLSARYADHLDDSASRASYFSSAFARAPEDAELGAQAIRAAISAGDLPLARALSIEMTALDKAEPMARIVMAAHDIKAAKYEKAAARLTAQPDDPSLGVMMALMEGWAHFGAGDKDEAMEVFSAIEVGGYFDIIAGLQKAEIATQSGDYAAAQALLNSVEKSKLNPNQTLMARVRLELARADTQAAKAALQAFSDERGGVETGPVATSLAALMAGKTPPLKMNAAQFASASLLDPAMAFFADQRALDTAELYLRTALIMDENNHLARLFLGNVLERENRPLEAQAIYDAVPKSSDYVVSVELARANLHFRNDEDKAGVNVLAALVKDHPTFLVREALGRGYLIQEDYEGALPYYSALLEGMTEDEIKDNTQPLYFRAICLHELGRWSEAEADLKRVLALEPDNAEALNFLGYTWVDRGENLIEAFEMIRKAVKLEPDSGAIIDSLGWAHYKLGQFEEARIHLEDASEKSPSSATIIDHLGDVYWKLGRVREAGYQWSRALDFDPTDEERAAITLKLERGMASDAKAP